MNHTVRYTIYARHSTDRQNPRSAEDQIDAIRRDIAIRHPDWIPVEPFYRDEAVSGTSTIGRDSFLQMIEDAQDGPFDVVLVEDVSRFSRNRLDSAVYRDRLADHDVQVLAQSDGYLDPDSETGVLMTAIKEAKAHADVLEIGRRARRGLEAQARKGFITGRPPFGYQRKPVFNESVVDADGRPMRIGVRLEPNPVTAPVVVRIFELYRDGLGFGSVAARLNEDGVPSATGGTWDQSAIRAIILNEAYLGHIVARKVEKKRKANGRKRVRRVPESQQIRCENAHEAIVSQELWGDVHALLAERRASLARKGLGSTRRGEYLLSGLVSCDSCSGSIVVETSGTQRYGKAKYYRCGIRRRRGPAVCDNRSSVRLERLDSIVVDLVRDKVLTRNRVTKILDRAAEFVAETKDSTVPVEEQLAALERQIQNVLSAITEAHGHLPGLVRRLEQLEAQKAALEMSIKKANRLLSPEDVTRRRLNRALRDVLRDFGDSEAVPQKREILRRCFATLSLREDRMLEAVTNPAGLLELVGIDVCNGGAGSGT